MYSFKTVVFLITILLVTKPPTPPASLVLSILEYILQFSIVNKSPVG